MRGRMIMGVACAGAVLGMLGVLSSFRRDIRAAHARLAVFDRSTVDTRHGRLEYAVAATGVPLLVSHGIFHGCDGGLLAVGPLVEDRRLVCPSRFGYLGTTMPSRATGAEQADAFALLLDHLGIDTVDVIAVSAGTGPAVQLALRHPDRVAHLIISSGNFPGSTTAEAPPAWARAFYSDGAMWTLKTFIRPMFAGLMGVPRGFPTNDEEAQVVDEMLDSIFPISPRNAGAVHDAYVSNPEIAEYRLEDIRVPTLLIHSRDDPLAAYEAAAAAAARIPAAVLVTLQSGGHLQLGQAARVRAEIGAFLETARHSASQGILDG